jgi:hypothetical protein
MENPGTGGLLIRPDNFGKLPIRRRQASARNGEEISRDLFLKTEY